MMDNDADNNAATLTMGNNADNINAAADVKADDKETQQPVIKEAREAMTQQGGGGVVVAVAVDVDRERVVARVPKRN